MTIRIANLAMILLIHCLRNRKFTSMGNKFFSRIATLREDSLVLVTCRSANNQWKIASGYFLAACIYDPTFNANKNYLATLTRKTIAKGLAINEMLAELQKHFDFLDAHVQLFLFDNEHGRKATFIGDRRKSHQSAIGVYYDKMNRQVYAVEHLSKMFGTGHNSEFCPISGEVFNVYTPEHHRCEAR